MRKNKNVDIVKENPCRCGSISFQQCAMGDGTQRMYCKECGNVEDAIYGTGYVDCVALWNAQKDLQAARKITKETKFKATLTVDDDLTGRKEGWFCVPRGVYWEDENVILVGNKNIVYPAVVIDVEVL